MHAVQREAGMGERLAQKMTVAADRLESLQRLVGVQRIAATLEEVRIMCDQLREQNHALVERGRRYEELFELAPEAYVRTNLDGIVRDANFIAGRLFGVDRSRLVGKPLAVFIPEGEQERFFERLASLRKRGERQKWTTALVARQGSPSDVVVTAGGVRDGFGSLTALHWIFHEVTKWRNRTESEAVRRKREYEPAIVGRVAQELSVKLDVEEIAEQLLRDVRKTIGAEAAFLWLWDQKKELVSETVSYAGMSISRGSLRVASHEEAAGWAAQNQSSVILNCASADDRFFRGIDEQTGVSTQSLISVPLRARGGALGVLEVVNKAAGDFHEDDLLRAETMATSAAIAIENTRLFQTLEARNEDLEAFADTVAHDIKASVTLMVGFADILEEDFETLSADDLGQYLRFIRRRGHKVADIVDALLHLAGIRNSQAKQEPLDMGMVVVDVRERLAATIEAYGAEVVTTAETWPIALGHGPWVEEVWANYLSNALEHGGVNPRIELGADCGARWARFWVQDDGPGVAPEDLETLFVPFVDQTSRDGGVRLGLSIVRRIVEKLGGDVGVENVRSGGSRFWFTLPKARGR